MHIESRTFIQDRWLTYHCLDQGFIIKVEADLNAHDVQAKNPWLCAPSIRYKDFDEQGFPTPQEATRLKGIKADFDALLKRESRGFFGRLLGAPSSVFVGSRTGACIFQLYYHGSADFFKEPLADLLHKHVLADSTFGLGNDSEWHNYINFLHPGPALAQLIRTRAQIEMREQAGDLLKVSRPVDHNFMFTSKGEREKFIRVVEKELAAAKIERVSGDQDSPFGVKLTLEHALDAVSAECNVFMFANQAILSGGKYDGFGAVEVHQPKSEKN